RRARRVATTATPSSKSAFAKRDQRIRGWLLREPLRMFLRLHHEYRPHHAGVIRPAILRTKKAIFPRSRGREPFRGVAPGNDILLATKIGNKEIVDHVLRRHDELDRLV